MFSFDFIDFTVGYFSGNERFFNFKQVDGCAMGKALSVTFSDIHMVKMENDIVIPSKPSFIECM